jgi:phosphoglycolate phosphatase-like HAD superfamily hydrolase
VRADRRAFIAGDSVFIGDSVTDIQAGRAARTPTIGYANRPKRRCLTGAGADVVIDTMHELARALRSAAAPPSA